MCVARVSALPSANNAFFISARNLARVCKSEQSSQMGMRCLDVRSCSRVSVAGVLWRGESREFLSLQVLFISEMIQ